MSPADIIAMLENHLRFVEGRPGGICADFSLQDLRGFDFSHQNLRDAKFTGADLQRCLFRGSNLSGADLYATNLAEADLEYAEMIKTNLRGTNLRGANLTGATLTHADMRDGKLMTAAKGRQVNFRSFDPRSKKIAARARLDGANMAETRFDTSSINQVDLTGAVLTGARLYTL